MYEIASCMIVEIPQDKELVCKSLSVTFFINNTHRRVFDGDIRMLQELQESKSFKNFKHDNFGEIMGMVEAYNIASVEVKNSAYDSVDWVLNNSVSAIKEIVSIEKLENSVEKEYIFLFSFY